MLEVTSLIDCADVMSSSSAWAACWDEKKAACSASKPTFANSILKERVSAAKSASGPSFKAYSNQYCQDVRVPFVSRLGVPASRGAGSESKWSDTRLVCTCSLRARSIISVMSPKRKTERGSARLLQQKGARRPAVMFCRSAAVPDSGNRGRWRGTRGPRAHVYGAVRVDGWCDWTAAQSVA